MNNISSKNIDNQPYLMVIGAWLGILATNISLLKIDITSLVDIPSIIFVVALILIAQYRYKRDIHGYVLGGASIYLIVIFGAMLATLTNKINIIPTMSVPMVMGLYLLIYMFFVHDTYSVSKMDSTIKLEDDITKSNKKDTIVLIGFMGIVGLVIVSTGAGFGAYFDIPSLLGIGSIFVAYIIKDEYKRLLVMKNFITGYPLIYFVIVFISLANNMDNFSIIGTDIAALTTSLLYLNLLYLVFLKPKFTNYKIDMRNSEKVLFVTTFVSVFSVLIFLVYGSY